IFERQGQLMEVEPRRLIDSATGLNNRLGLERVLAEWTADPANSRRASFALMDIDRMGRVNEEHGPLVADRVIAEVGRLVTETLRRDRGFDAVARLSGQILAVFLGDTEAPNAGLALERVRQTIQAH